MSRKLETLQMLSDPPLVTFAVLTFNQERFIKEAVSSALQQDYPNLEIIISDDCSTDATFERALLEVNKFGQSRIPILTRNNENIGLISHVNKINQMAKGELIIVAAGDDISFPNRASRIVEEWRSNPQGSSFHSAVIKIDENGVKGKKWKTRDSNTNCLQNFIERDVVIGATQAWSPTLHNCYGPITSLDAREDRIIASRAAMYSTVHFIDEPLVYYRTSGLSNSNYGASSSEQSTMIEARLRMNELAQATADGINRHSHDGDVMNQLETSTHRVIDDIFTKVSIAAIFARASPHKSRYQIVYAASRSFLVYLRLLHKIIFRRV